MEFLESVKLIQGGMSAYVSNWRLAWITEDVGRIFPRQWERFAAAVPEHLRDRRLVDAYAELLFDRDLRVQAHAAQEWCAWEDAHVSLAPGHRPNPRYQDPAFRLLFARLVTHYWRNAAFLEPDQLLRDASLLNGIPGVLIHGHFDVSSPLETAWHLSQRWTTSRLQVIGDGGAWRGRIRWRTQSRARRSLDLNDWLISRPCERRRRRSPCKRTT